MPSITVTIAGLGRTKIISTSDYTARLLPALRYFNPDLSAVTHPAGTEPTVTTEGEPPAVIPPLVLEPATDEEIIQRWADRIIADLISSIEVYEDTKRVKWPAPGSEDTELGVLMELEVGHGETEVYPRVQA